MTKKVGETTVEIRGFGGYDGALPQPLHKNQVCLNVRLGIALPFAPTPNALKTSKNAHCGDKISKSSVWVLTFSL